MLIKNKLKSIMKPCNLILFGTKGDLAKRKLLPSLYKLEKANLIHKDSKIIGVARDNESLNNYINFVKESLNNFLNEDINNSILDKLIKRLNYISIDLNNLDEYQKLKDLNLDNPINYLSVPPSLFNVIAQGLNSVNLNSGNSKIVVEKPIGHNLESSKIINDDIAKYFKENQIYRIDHYLGKEIVQNILPLRFANSIFLNNWNNKTIDHVQITITEQIGVEGRWNYYDNAGQVRDMLQNHILQLLSLIAMEKPLTLNADNIRNEKIKVLKSLKPITKNSFDKNIVFGQYDKGFISNQEVPAYKNEKGANNQSKTETFIAIKTEIENERWNGITFYLRTGKRIGKKITEIVIYFKDLENNIFINENNKLNNKLVIDLVDSSIKLNVLTKNSQENKEIKLEENQLSFNLDNSKNITKDENNEKIFNGYERLLLEIMLENQQLFVHRNEVENSWIWIDNILNIWQTKKDKGDNPRLYNAGSFGPIESDNLINQDNRSWNK